MPAPLRIAFYAPLKAPTHPVPSGDQRLAQLFMQALEAAGYQLQLASELRSFSAAPPDETAIAALKKAARGEQRRLLALWQSEPWLKPDLWVSYHLYHKAPDLLGPLLCRLLKIPYLVIEASWAPKRLPGPWHWGMTQVARALRRADQLIAINPKDQPCIDRFRQTQGLTSSIYLAPFIDAAGFRQLRQGRSRAELAASYGVPADRRWLLSVAMIRPGDKLASYRMLAEALIALQNQRQTDWHWLIIGSGSAQAELETLLAPLQGHYSLLGRGAAAEVANWMAEADLLVWPAVNEALGMIFLEAATLGLPILAGSTPGVASVCPASAELIEEVDARKLTRALERRLTQPVPRSAPGDGGFDRAKTQLSEILCSVMVQHRRQAQGICTDD